jgi:hypothetical protein
MYNPPKCSCFGGHCMKHLCWQRTLNKEVAKQEKATEPQPKPSRSNIRVYRDGVTYEGPTVPPGRIPPKR